MGDTSIEWTDKSWNPIRGCSRVSRGCERCYAEIVAARFSGPGQAYEGLAYRNSSGAHWTGKVRLIEEHLEDPLRWKKPRRIFVNSMSDLFHEGLEDYQIAQVFAVMACAQQHVFQVLTKRPERMKATLLNSEFISMVNAFSTELAFENTNPHARTRDDYRAIVRDLDEDDPFSEPLPNVWLGVSVEDQKTADERIPLLLQTPAAVRWISVEPLLGPIRLPLRCPSCNDEGCFVDTEENCLVKCNCADARRRWGISWVVTGAESGTKARPMELDWVRSLKDQCVAAGVPFFYKQDAIKGKKIPTPELDGKVWIEFPEVQT